MVYNIFSYVRFAAKFVAKRLVFWGIINAELKNARKGWFFMDSSEIKQLKILAAKARQGAILGTYHAKSGHPGGSLSAADIFTYLYYKEMKVDPKNPQWEDRDRFVLSKGHCCPSLYAVLALKGYSEKEFVKG